MSEPIGTRAETYPAVIPYLLVRDAAALIRFLEQAFGARLSFAGSSDDGRLMHGEIRLGDGMIMIADATEETGAVCLCHYVKDTDAVYYRAVAAGAVSIAEPKTEHYGDRVAGVKDPAGNTWWICARPA
jgi:uncharacterized glyoxalase superfamily protein PhnB